MRNEPENVQVLGVRIDDCPEERLKKMSSDSLSGAEKRIFITTPNPEILLEAHRNRPYREILNGADLNICDGFGIQLVSFLQGKKIKNRFPGSDAAKILLAEAEKAEAPVLVIIPDNSLSKPAEIEKAVKEIFPSVTIKATCPNGNIFLKNESILNSKLIFVCLGAPEQEIFIFENRNKFPSARIFMGAGGTFDFLTKRIRRAPWIFRKMGIEWVWRLLLEPRRRIGRIFKAVVLFPAIALFKSN